MSWLTGSIRQCSARVTCSDLAVMAATLANDGVNPLTGKRALPSQYIQDVLTVMNSCGMYNYAGQWSYEVGMPAKSGVSGGIIAVIPGQIGIGVFSPRLDAVSESPRSTMTRARNPRNAPSRVTSASAMPQPSLLPPST